MQSPVIYTNQQPPQHGGAIPYHVWAGLKWLLIFLRVPVTSWTPLTQIFFPCCSLNDCKRAASLKSIDCFLSLARLLILFHLLMSGNVHPNLGLVFLCSVCARNVTRRGKSQGCKLGQFLYRVKV